MTTVKTKETKTKSNTLVEGLNRQIANGFVLYTKLHNFHWYVKGKTFFVLHEKFEELYNETTLQTDEVAERLLAIGGKPVATMSEFAKIATIKDATGKESPDEMVRSLIKDFEMLLGELKETMEAAAEAEDEGTEDMLLGIRTGLEKHLWMLNAYLD